MIRRNWKSWLLAIPGWILGFVTGFALTAAWNVVRRSRGNWEDVANWSALILIGLTLALVIYLTFKQEWKWRPWKIAFVLGLPPIPVMWFWFVVNYGIFS